MNKTLKKLVSLVLCVFMCASMSCMVLAEEAEKVAEVTSVSYDAEVLEAMEFLKILEIIPSDYREFDMGSDVLRADFADSVARILNAATYNGTTPYFYDVPMSYWAYQSISALAERGVIGGSSDKIFSPDERIKTADACKILLTAMGYDKYAANNGGYPTGYLTTAKRIGVLDNLKVSEYLTSETMIKILYNALKTGIFDVVSIENDDAVYSKSEDTLLSIYHGIRYGEGIVQGANGVSFNSKGLKSGEVEIDGKVFASEFELFDALGEDVEFFYREGVGDDRDVVIWARKSGDSDVLYVNADSDARFDVSSFKLKYFENKNDTKEKNAEIARNVILVYNGGVVTKNIDHYFSLPMYDVKLVKGEGRAYDVAVMECYKSFVVGSVDTTKEIIYNKHNAKEYVELSADKYDYVSVTCEGVALGSASEILSGNTASIFKSEDGKYMYVKISRRSVSGVLASYSIQDNGAYLEIGNEDYFYPDCNVKLDAYLGAKVDVNLDFNSRVVHIEASSYSATVGYLIGAEKSVNGLANSVDIKILTEDNVISVFRCDEKVKIDGVTYKGNKKIYEVLMAGEAAIKQQLIAFETNADGVITKIDTPYVNTSAGEDANTLQANVERQKGYWRANLNHNGNMPMNSSTKIFAIPTDSSNAEDDDYSVIGGSATPSDISSCYAASYKTKEKVGIEQYIVLEWDRKDVSPSGYPVIVEDVRKVASEDGVATTMVYGYRGATKISMKLDPDKTFDTVTPGTIMRIGYYGDTIVSLKKLTTVEDIINGDRLHESYNTSATIYYGAVVDLVDNVVKIDTKDDENYDAAVNLAGVNVRVWDASGRKGTLSSGQISDIQPGDFVMVGSNYTNTSFAVVIKR